jgi:L-aminopeptidase/D-esterase-like protein
MTPPPDWKDALTDVPGFEVGHADDADALTGCTVVLCSQGAVGGVDQRGGAPGTREIDALRPVHLVQQAHAVVLAGGSAFGLDAASGAVRWLEERGVGFDVRVARVPIVPAAILFDLGLGRPGIRPDAAMGYRACQAASAARPREGNAGAGMGCTVGKILGVAQATKGGLGTASLDLGGGLVVGALVAVNAFGDVLDGEHIIAGARAPGAGPPRFAGTLAVMQALAGGEAAERRDMRFGAPAVAPGGQPPGATVLGVVATNARLNKEQANKVAQMAHDGLARTIRPAHTMLDGDTIFALALGDKAADVNTIGAFAAEVVARAIHSAIWAAEPAGGLPSARSLAALGGIAAE